MHLSQQIRDLHDLEAAFQNAAEDKHIMPQEKAGLLNAHLSAMEGITIMAIQEKNAQASEISEFVSDFISRDDLGPAWLDAAFPDDMAGAVFLKRNIAGSMERIRYICEERYGQPEGYALPAYEDVLR